MASPRSSVRLYALLARAAPVAVVFRRGPSRQLQLLRWNTDTDTFEPGQWFKGRIYERRCDLSPSGRRLIYFAATCRKPLYSWTAVSRPPFLAAVALWPKGDGWGGGGLFARDSQIRLNHRPGEMRLADGFKLPKHVFVSPYGARPSWGEDAPIMGDRLARDGWALVQQIAKARLPWVQRPAYAILLRVRSAANLGEGIACRMDTAHDRARHP